MAKLIFYSTVSPDRDDDAWGVFSLAARAVKANLDAEMYLAGAGTGLIRKQVRDRVEGPRAREALRVVLESKMPIFLAGG